MAENPILAHARRFERVDEEPAHIQIVRWISMGIDLHGIADGTRVPSERALSEALGVSRMTLRKALEALAGEGGIRRATGSRIWRVDRRPEIAIDVSEFSSVTEQLVKAAGEVTTRVLFAETRVATAEECRQFNFRENAGERIHVVHRVRVVGGDPVIFERSLIPASVAAELLELDLTGSLYEVLRTGFGRTAARARHRIRAVNLTAEDAEVLAQRRGVAVLRLERTTEDVDGRVIEASEDLIRSDRLAVTTVGDVATAL